MEAALSLAVGHAITGGSSHPHTVPRRRSRAALLSTRPGAHPTPASYHPSTKQLPLLPPPQPTKARHNAQAADQEPATWVSISPRRPQPRCSKSPLEPRPPDHGHVPRCTAGPPGAEDAPTVCAKSRSADTVGCLDPAANSQIAHPLSLPPDPPALPPPPTHASVAAQLDCEQGDAALIIGRTSVRTAASLLSTPVHSACRSSGLPTRPEPSQ